MSLKPFRIPETRLLVVSDLVVQVTLTFRSSDDEELQYRYTDDPLLQSLVQTAVISLVNCSYTNGVCRGPGFILHQLRKKWPIGRRYIFAHHGEPLHSSTHKYFFQLEFTDHPREVNNVELEITEIRSMDLSPTPSSYAGSVIDGLDSVSLPPIDNAMVDGPGRGSDQAHYNRRMSTDSYQERLQQQQKHSAQKTPNSVAEYARHYSPKGMASRDESPVADDATMRTRSVSRSTIGSAAGSIRTIKNTAVDQARSQADSDIGTGAGGTREGSDDEPPISGSTTVTAVAGLRSAVISPGFAGQPRLGHTQWYRSLHGISPLSRQPKSISSSDTEFLSPTTETAAVAAAVMAANNGNAGASGTPGSTQPANSVQQSTKPNLQPTMIPRANIARVGGQRNANEGSESGQVSGLVAAANRLRRKVMAPLRAHSRGKSTSGRSAIETQRQQSAIPRPPVSTYSRFISKTPNGSGLSVGSGITRPDMPPPSVTRRPASAMAGSVRRMSISSVHHTPTSAIRTRPAEPVSIPTAVKNALMRRLRSPFSGRPDHSSPKLSVKERIEAYNTMSANDTEERPKTPANVQRPASSAGSSMSVTTSPVALAPVDRPSGPSTPPRPLSRKRVATATGFISVGSPSSVAASPGASTVSGRPISRTSSKANPGHLNTVRSGSPALSQRSNVSSRIQDTIQALERANAESVNTPRNKPKDAVLSMLASGNRVLSDSGDGARKRNFTGSDEFMSPTKRPRVPSMSAVGLVGSKMDVDGGGGTKNAAQQMLRRNTDR
ncbi:hypothetical protein GGI07_004175 [Coemansia sp. Benny D115]|nr:hypothetical protein GGI07_004175 [Coemansia sp. Benny D115]